jgi:ketosteroid isomerase-like protein
MCSSDPQDFLALVADNIECIIPGERWALAGTYRGHVRVAAVLRRASQEIEMTYPTPPSPWRRQASGVQRGRYRHR